MVNQETAGESDRPDTARALLDIVRETCQDLHRHQPLPAEVGLDVSLERDLGLDSLSRVELLIRAERAFGVRLAEDTLTHVDTPRDLLAALDAGDRVGAATPPAAVRARQVEDLAGEPDEALTLTDALDWHVRRHPARTQIIIASAEGEQEIAYGTLMIAAAGVAARLQGEGVEPGQAVAIMLPTGAAYFHAFFGILLAGGIPVPIYPPTHLSRIEEHVRRHAGILSNAQAVALITVDEAMPAARVLSAFVPGLRAVFSTTGLSGDRQTFTRVDAKPGDVAFIQYTSGSTGNPKGVVLTHANLLANIRAIGKAVRIVPQDVFVSWLPLYHDMGLIAAWLASLYYGNLLVVLSPLTFLARPESWLWAIHRHRGTLTAAPNFAYELCVKRVADQDIEELDLDSLRFAANGAEPVSPATMERFSDRFARWGFRREAMTPVYGLAESSVALIVPPPGRGPRVDRVGRDALIGERRADPAPADDPNPILFVSCGRPIAGHRVRIVNEDGVEVGERVEGRLEFRGPSATAGYRRNPEATRQLLHDGWLDTGDRAYVAEGEVYITGRVKDIIIRGGRNIHPQEIEEAVGALPGVRKGCVAAFGSTDAVAGTERLVVLAETREFDAGARDRIRQAIQGAVADVIGEPPDEIVLAPPHTVPKTSSGKLRRAASREVFESGLVGAHARAVWWQFARLAATGAAARARHAPARARRFLYAAYAWTLFGAIAPAAWLLTAALPRPAWAWAIGRGAARLLLGLAGVRLNVEGAAILRDGEPHVMVANHASYLDGLVLVAAISQPHRFVAKRELLDNVISRVYLRRLGAVFIERFAAQQSVDDASRLAGAAVEGAPLAVFPEGTFRRPAGVRSFRLGAFAAAAQAGIPVVPVAIRGTRSILPAGAWMPRRHEITVTISEPIAPAADASRAFAVGVTLRDAARAAIVRHAGEADVEHAP